MTFPTFSAGNVLTAADMNAVGLWLVKTQTITNGSSDVTVTGAFSADYDANKVIIANGGSAANSNCSLQIGASTTGYYCSYTGVTFSTGAASLAADNNAASFTLAAFSTTTTLNMNVDIMNPFLADSTVIFGSRVGGIASGGFLYSGVLNDTTSHTSFKVTCATSTFTGGTIRVYGYRN
jgi:hypothetical protein